MTTRIKQTTFLGWLDLGAEDQRRAREYLSQFNADNTLDELGFGILRDAFSDVFFPATNTIMTRTRYLVFIPALCLVIEREKLAGNSADDRLTELENVLRESLQKEESTGVIGAHSGEALQRYPSSIYWSALRRLGIFIHPNWGLEYYLSHLADFNAAMKAEKDDDGLSHLDAPDRRNWDKYLCGFLADGHGFWTGKGKLPSSLNFTLTHKEASYLRDRYQVLAQQDGHPSMISHLLETRCLTAFSYPWDVPCPPTLTAHVNHARCLSMLVRGATLQYFYLLKKERAARAIATTDFDVNDVFDRWWDASSQDLAQWDIEAFLTLATGLNALRRQNDASFIKSWLKLNLNARSAKAMLNNNEAQELIRRRERLTRPSKARLHHIEYLQRWKPPEASDMESMASDADRLRFGLDYRARIGSTFVVDIGQGL